MANENNEKNKYRVIFLQKDQNGQRFGSGEWIEGVNVYVNNFRKKGDALIADVDIKTDETYVNKQGKVCNRHKICGIMRLSAEECVAIVEINNVKEKLTCTPRNVIGKKNNKPYIVLDFNGDDRTNPYETDLGFDSNEEALDNLEMPY